MAHPLTEQRHTEVWRQLDGVSDPELDEPVTDLQFVTAVDVDPEGHVHIGFRLPTYWCAANFSFLMADDMRAAVASLAWVKTVEVHLGEHMYADKINAGMKQGLSFAETFGAEADGDLDSLRHVFLVKAFQRRQAALLGHLVARGSEPAWMLALTIAELRALPMEGEGETVVRRYLERRGVVGPVREDALAFIDPEGAALKPDSFAVHLRNLRRVGVNAEFNSALCKGLLAARFDTETPFVSNRRRLHAAT